MPMTIKPVDQTIKNLLEAGFYEIPGFQRPYSWDSANVEDFWNDTILTEDTQYFIGSFVLYPSKDSTDSYCVVDGQQRLTTITLLLAALRNCLDGQGFNDLAKGIHGLIEKEDINHRKQFVLQSESPYPYLQEHIQKFGKPLDAFEGGFGAVRYTDDNTKQRGIVHYILRRIEILRRAGEGLDLKNYTIEHLAPQHPPSGTARLADDFVGSLGNMIFVAEELNAELENKDFAAKKKALQDRGFPLDPVLSKAVTWAAPEIQERAKWLAGFAYKSVFKV